MKLSKKSALVLLTALALAAVLPACPDDARKDAVNAVGGAPKDQVDVAKERLGKAEDKLQERANAAAATE